MKFFVLVATVALAGCPSAAKDCGEDPAPKCYLEDSARCGFCPGNMSACDEAREEQVAIERAYGECLAEEGDAP